MHTTFKVNCKQICRLFYGCVLSYYENLYAVIQQTADLLAKIDLKKLTLIADDSFTYVFFVTYLKSTNPKLSFRANFC